MNYKNFKRSVNSLVASGALTDSQLEFISNEDNLKIIFKTYSDSVQEDAREANKEAKKEERLKKKEEEIFAAKQLIKARQANIDSKQLVNDLTQMGFSQTQVAEMMTVVNVSAKLLETLDLNVLNQINNSIDSILDLIYPSTIGTLAPKIKGGNQAQTIFNEVEEVGEIVSQEKVRLLTSKQLADLREADAANKVNKVEALKLTAEKLRERAISTVALAFSRVSEKILQPQFTRFIDVLSLISRDITANLKESNRLHEPLDTAWNNIVISSGFKLKSLFGKGKTTRERLGTKYGIPISRETPAAILAFYAREVVFQKNKGVRGAYGAASMMQNWTSVTSRDEAFDTFMLDFKKSFFTELEDGSLEFNMKKAEEFLSEKIAGDKTYMDWYKAARKSIEELTSTANEVSIRDNGRPLPMLVGYFPTQSNLNYQTNEEMLASVLKDMEGMQPISFITKNGNLEDKVAVTGFDKLDVFSTHRRYVEEIITQHRMNPEARTMIEVVNTLQRRGDKASVMLGELIKQVSKSAVTNPSEYSSFSRRVKEFSIRLREAFQRYKISLISSPIKFATEWLPSMGQAYVSFGHQVFNKGYKIMKTVDSNDFYELMASFGGDSNLERVASRLERKEEAAREAGGYTKGSFKSYEGSNAKKDILRRFSDLVFNNKYTIWWGAMSEKVNTSVQKSLDYMPMMITYAGTFDKEFKRLTGQQFDYSRIRDISYMIAYEEQIKLAKSLASKNANIVSGPGSYMDAPEGDKQTNTWLKDFKTFRTLANLNSTLTISRLLRDGYNDRDARILAGYLVQSTGNFAAKLVLNYMFQLMAEAIAGDDDDEDMYKKSEAMIDGALSLENVMTAASFFVLEYTTKFGRLNTAYRLAWMAGATFLYYAIPNKSKEQVKEKLGVDPEKVIPIIMKQSELTAVPYNNLGVAGGYFQSVITLASILNAKRNKEEEEEDILQEQKTQLQLELEYMLSQKAIDAIDVKEEKQNIRLNEMATKLALNTSTLAFGMPVLGMLNAAIATKFNKDEAILAMQSRKQTKEAIKTLVDGGWKESEVKEIWELQEKIDNYYTSTKTKVESTKRMQEITKAYIDRMMN